ncbi:MAG: hypothetical protein J2P52_02185 [Blastocatellia bacterium]|nr:hypothetical protein [Blastocatellia bacterium]
MLSLLGLSPSLEVYAQGGDPNLGGNKPAPTPGPKDSKLSSSAPSPHTLAFGVERKGKLDPKTSGKNASGSLYEEMILKAESEDSLSFRVKSNDPSLDTSLGLQIFGRNNAEVAVAKASPGEFKIATPTGGLPANGDYRVRVTGPINGRSAVPFTIKVDRLGLTSTAYNERFSKIYEKYNEKDPASVEETAVKLERLARDAPNYPTAFERLGIIYLESRNDIGKAEWAFAQAIKTGGVARLAISYDSKWRQMTKLRSGDTGFEDKRTGWLRIKAGMLTLHDARDKMLVTLTGQQIKELSKTLAATYNLVQITTDNPRRTYIIAPERMRQVDADLVVKLLQNHATGKAY